MGYSMIIYLLQMEKSRNQVKPTLQKPPPGLVIRQCLYSPLRPGSTSSSTVRLSLKYSNTDVLGSHCVNLFHFQKPHKALPCRVPTCFFIRT